MSDVLFDTGLPATGALQLQVCEQCGEVNYPRRELCGHCLADALSWRPVDDGGTVQSMTELQHSLEDQYAEKLPWRVASVLLDCGPVAFAHLQPGVAVNGRVSLRILEDAHGSPMLVALGDRANAAQWLKDIDFREDSP